MLPYLAATGHNNYTKSIVLFLEKMQLLPESHPSVFAKFHNGLFVVRRTDKYWSGIFSDLFIEQVLMSNVKSIGGLAWGRGFSETTRLLFLLSMPARGEMCKALQ